MIIMAELNKSKDLNKKERSSRNQKLLSMLDEIDKKNYNATTKAVAQIMAIMDIWSDLDINWMEILDKIKNQNGRK